MFGTRYVGGIHGRLLTAWSTAGVLGPVLVSSANIKLASAWPRRRPRRSTLYIMAGLLALGFVCDPLMYEVRERHYMRHGEVDDPLQG